MLQICLKSTSDTLTSKAFKPLVRNFVAIHKSKFMKEMLTTQFCIPPKQS